MRTRKKKEKLNKGTENSIKQDKKGAFRHRKLFFIFYLFVVSSMFTAGTLSKYMTSVAGYGTAQVAKPICEIFFPDNMQITDGSLVSGEENIYIGVRNYTPAIAAESSVSISEVAMTYQITMSISGAAVEQSEYEIYGISKDGTGNEVRTKIDSNKMEGRFGISEQQESIYLIVFNQITTQTETAQLEFKLTSEQILN